MKPLFSGLTPESINPRRMFKLAVTTLLVTNALGGIGGFAEGLRFGGPHLPHYRTLRDSMSVSTVQKSPPKFIFANLAMGAGMRAGEGMAQVIKAYGETRHKMNLGNSLP